MGNPSRNPNSKWTELLIPRFFDEVDKEPHQTFDTRQLNSYERVNFGILLEPPTKREISSEYLILGYLSNPSSLLSLLREQVEIENRWFERIDLPSRQDYFYPNHMNEGCYYKNLTKLGKPAHRKF